MSTHRKIRGDSILGTLPEERQAEIAAYAQEHTLKETAAWLKADGITVSPAALSLWLSSWSLRQRFTLADADTVEFIRLLKERNPNLPESELQQFGAEYFQMQAMKMGDAKTFLKFATARTKAEMEKAKLAQKDRALEFDQTKFAASLKTKIEHGLDALFEEIKGNAEARALFEKFKAVVTKATA